MICSGQLHITCTNCGHQNTFNCADLSFGEIEGTPRGMGDEIHHNAEIDFECGSCGEPLQGTYDVWEYPTGAKNHEEIEVSNGTVTQNCTIQF